MAYRGMKSVEYRSLPPLVGEGARRAGEGRWFHENERLGERRRRPSSSFTPSPPMGKGEKKGDSGASPFLRAGFQTGAGFTIKNQRSHTLFAFPQQSVILYT
jgi:hypothetical protein